MVCCMSRCDREGEGSIPSDHPKHAIESISPTIGGGLADPDHGQTCNGYRIIQELHLDCKVLFGHVLAEPPSAKRPVCSHKADGEGQYLQVAPIYVLIPKGTTVWLVTLMPGERFESNGTLLF